MDAAPVYPSGTSAALVGDSGILDNFTLKNQAVR
jgi:hypothetical protein